MTRIDIEANGEADELAKRAVEEHRVPFRLRDEWRRCHETTKQRAMWVARVAVEANNLPYYPFSDSESSRMAADEAKRLKAKEKAREELTDMPTDMKKMVVARPPTLGGHSIVTQQRRLAMHVLSRNVYLVEAFRPCTLWGICS